VPRKLNNAEWLAWFDTQSQELRRIVMMMIDDLESNGIPGDDAHTIARELVATSADIVTLYH